MDIVKSFFTQVLNQEKKPGSAIYYFPCEKIKEFVTGYENDPKVVIDFFKDELRKLSIEDKCRLIEGLVDYILQLTSASNIKGESRFLFYQDLNGRSHRDGGEGGFGSHMYTYRDILIAIILESKDLLADSSDHISEVLQKVLIRQLHYSDRSHRRSFRDKNQHSNETEFRLYGDYINVESSTFLVLGDRMFGNALPYFSDELFQVLSMFPPYKQEINVCSEDFFIREINNHLHYRNNKPFSLILDYESFPDIGLDPAIDIHEGQDIEDPKSWSISTSLGKCSYSYKPNGNKVSIEITLYMQTIKRIAKELNLDPYYLMMVVYIHELSHYIYFTGQFSFGLPFVPVNDKKFDFGLFGTDDFHEAIAQYSTYLTIKEDSDLCKTFKVLNQNQSDNYQLWSQMMDLDGFEIGKRLMMANKNEMKKNFINFFK